MSLKINATAEAAILFSAPQHFLLRRLKVVWKLMKRVSFHSAEEAWPRSERQED